MKTFGEVLAHFKTEVAEQDCVENITPLVEDANLRNALVAWKSVAVRYKKAEQCPYEDEPRQWNWMWSIVDYDMNQFGAVAGLKAQDVNAVLTRLIGLRLIYPDGTVNNLARQYLQAIIMSKLTSKRGAGRPKKGEAK